MKVDDSNRHCSVTFWLVTMMTLFVWSVLPATADVNRAPEQGNFVTGQQSDQASEAIPVFALNEGNSQPVNSAETTSHSTGIAREDSEESAKLRPRVMGDIRPSLDYAWGDVKESALPDDFSSNTDDEPISRVIGTPMLLQWQPSNLWYHPLYFEDPALERYGHTYNPLLQSIVSTGRFVGQAATMPYHATLRPHHSCEYPLGWHRPGECVPHLKYRTAWNEEAAVNQALAIVGLVFLIP